MNFEQALHKKLYRGDCPSAETLHDYYWHELSVEKISSVTDHFGDCPDCATEYVGLVSFLAPKQREVKKLSLLEQLTTFVAKLSTPLNGAAAMRGQLDMIFETSDEQLVFLNWRRDERAYFILKGKLFPPPAESVEAGVQLIAKGEAVSADLHPDGEFTFTDLDAGSYQIVIQSTDSQILIPHVEIAAAR